jgi:hypothetical protein
MGTTFDKASREPDLKATAPQSRRRIGRTQPGGEALRPACIQPAVAGMLAAQPVSAAGPDDEIRIGNTMPYSGQLPLTA